MSLPHVVVRILAQYDNFGASEWCVFECIKNQAIRWKNSVGSLLGQQKAAKRLHIRLLKLGA